MYQVRIRDTQKGYQPSHVNIKNHQDTCSSSGPDLLLCQAFHTPVADIGLVHPRQTKQDCAVVRGSWAAWLKLEKAPTFPFRSKCSGFKVDGTGTPRCLRRVHTNHLLGLVPSTLKPLYCKNNKLLHRTLLEPTVFAQSAHSPSSCAIYPRE